MDEINPAIATFVQEARDQLEGLEGLLLDLEGGTAAEQVDAVFRTLHTVKGSGAMFGFGVLARFTHHFEDAFDRVREGRLSVNQPLIDLSLRARDHMMALLDCGGDGPEAEALAAAPAARELLEALARLTGAAHDVDLRRGGRGTEALPRRESCNDGPSHSGLNPVRFATGCGPIC